MFSPSLVVVDDTGGGREDNMPKLTRRQQLDDPLVDILQFHVIPRTEDSAFVDTVRGLDIAVSRGEGRVVPANELYDELAASMIVNLFEFADVS
jgi:hypothetical protein